MIEIKITGVTPLEALGSLTAFGRHCMRDGDVCAAADRVIAAEKSDVSPAPPVVPVNPTLATTGNTATVGSQTTAPFNPTPPAVPVAPPPSFTIDQIATAGAALVQTGKMADLMALLGQFGVQAVTELKPEQLGPFATALRGLGANI